jgi:hypothetical protein
VAKKAKSIKVYRDGRVWVAQKIGSSRASAIRNTKKEAYEAAREIALNQGLAILVYDKYGKFQKRVWPEDNDADEDCFITTACTKYYGLPDSCYELTVLRRFRDNHLLQTTETAAFVKQYYRVAPRLVACLEISKSKNVLYKNIYRQIRNACACVESDNYDEAIFLYTSTILSLLGYFKIGRDGGKR